MWCGVEECIVAGRGKLLTWSCESFNHVLGIWLLNPTGIWRGSIRPPLFLSPTRVLPSTVHPFKIYSPSRDPRLRTWQS